MESPQGRVTWAWGVFKRAPRYETRPSPTARCGECTGTRLEPVTSRPLGVSGEPSEHTPEDPTLIS